MDMDVDVDVDADTHTHTHTHTHTRRRRHTAGDAHGAVWAVGWGAERSGAEGAWLYCMAWRGVAK